MNTLAQDSLFRAKGEQRAVPQGSGHGARKFRYDELRARGVLGALRTEGTGVSLISQRTWSVLGAWSLNRRRTVGRSGEPYC